MPFRGTGLASFASIRLPKRAELPKPKGVHQKELPCSELLVSASQFIYSRSQRQTFR